MPADPPTVAMTSLKLAAGNGRPTAQNFAASEPDVPLELGAANVLCLMSGGETKVTLRELEVAITTAVYMDREKLGSLSLLMQCWALPSISAVIHSALEQGLETSSRGSMRAALHYLVSFIREKRRSAPDDFTFSRVSSFMPLPQVAAAALPQRASWVAELMFRSGIDSGNDAVVLAALINVLPDRYTPGGRASDDFVDAASELYAEALTQQPDLALKRPARQASTVVTAMSTRVPDARFLVYCPPELAFEEVQIYRYKAEDTVQIRFKNSWSLSYAYLSMLLTPTCPASEAWSHAAMLLEDKPTYETLAALDSKIGGLLSMIDSDPDLKESTASTDERVMAMHKLLRVKVAADSKSDGLPADNMMDKAVLLKREASQKLVEELHKHDTTPVVEHRVIYVMLTFESMMGWQYLAGKPPALAFLKKFVSCQDEGAVVLAFKRYICVDAKDVKQQSWYPDLDVDNNRCTLPMKMLKGTFAKDGQLNFNPWKDLVGPMVKKYMGTHAVRQELDSLAQQHPPAFFTNAFMLKYGSEHLVRLFGFVGAGGDEDNSVSAVLATIEKYVERIDLVPDVVHSHGNQRLEHAGAKNTCKVNLQKAAVGAMNEYATRIRAALNSPPLTSTRPAPFAPMNGGFAGSLAKIEEMLRRMEKDVAYAIDVAQASGLPLPPLLDGKAPASQGPSSDFSVGPSVSQAGSQLSSPMLAQLTAATLEALRSQTGAASEYSQFQQGGGASQAAQDGAKGSMAHTLTYEKNGVWANTPSGRKWCGAKGFAKLDLNRVCAASLLPANMDKNAYCTNGANCSHKLGRGFTAVQSNTPIAEADLIKKGTGGDGGGRGKGKGGGAKKGAGRGAGKPKAKPKSKKRKAAAAAESDGDIDEGDE